MSAPQLYLLGPPRVARDNQSVELTSAKAIALLAYLAAAGRPQTRERLLGLLWGESPAEAARKNLRNTLWAIRKALGDDVVSADDDRLALGPAVWVDLHEFERSVERGTGPDRKASLPFSIPAPGDRSSAIQPLRAAIACYRGPFLDGFLLDDSSEFELWLTAERERLGQLYLRLLAVLLELHRAEGDWASVIEVARLGLAHDNLQEPMVRALMEAQARLGQRAEALRQYETLHTILARELGVEPLPETEALRAAILGGEVRPAAPPGRRPQPILGGPAQTPYVGRLAERAALDAELLAAMTGRARVVAITGELGIGKSRLWQEWSAALPSAHLVLEARCLESTQALPFAPLAELFGSRACADRLFRPPSPVPAIWLAEIARLLPQLRTALPDLPPPAAVPPEEERRRIFEAFTQCLLALAARPLLLGLDDLHCADGATLDWLDYFVHHLRGQALLLVVAYRPDEAPHPMLGQIAGWEREGLLRRLPLPRLTESESSELMASLVGDRARRERLSDVVQAQSAGNPYFLVELCRASPGDVPPALSELLRARLDRLSGSVRQVLQAAAVLEPDFEFAALRRTSGRGEEEVLDALDALLNAALLYERDGRFAFAHPLVAQVVRDGMSGPRRAFLHRRAAEALESASAGRRPQIAGRLATHFAAAGDLSRAAGHFETAGAHALSLAAPAEAANFYRRAVELEPTPARRLGLGRALYRRGDLTEARGVLETALHEFEAQGDRRGALQTCLTLYDSHLRAGHFQEVVRWAERGLTYLDPEADPESRAFALHLLGAAKLHAEQSLVEAEAHLREAGQLAERHHLLELAARSRFGLANVFAQRGDLAGAVRAYREATGLAQAAGDHFHEVLGHNNAAYHLMLMGDLQAAHEHVAIGLSLAESRALHVMHQWLYSTRGEIALAEGQWAEAEDWFARGLAEAEKHANLEMIVTYRANLGLAARGRGDLQAALAHLQVARDSAPSPQLQTRIDLRLTELHLQLGDRAPAEARLAQAEARLAGSDQAFLQAWAERLRRQIP